ncbi:hypothetical protein [Streptomyces sp. Root1310]|uniref:hypothetical protein n=1 Tax=Streptomyces sp. Root1310 TaxID=1736452 RepID=UPI0032B76A8E
MAELLVNSTIAAPVPVPDGRSAACRAATFKLPAEQAGAAAPTPRELSAAGVAAAALAEAEAAEGEATEGEAAEGDVAALGVADAEPAEAGLSEAGLAEVLGDSPESHPVTTRAAEATKAAITEPRIPTLFQRMYPFPFLFACVLSSASVFVLSSASVFVSTSAYLFVSASAYLLAFSFAFAFAFSFVFA